MLLPIHIIAGGLALILGTVTLVVKKGGHGHRRSGRLFAAAMLIMGGTASMLGFQKSPTDANVFAGVMTAYFVVTAITTVRPVSSWTRIINGAALAVAAVLAAGAFVGGLKGVRGPGLSDGGVPLRTIGVMSFVLASVLFLAAVGDLRVLCSGVLRGGPRLARHLWRMCFALFIAAGSFFSIRERVATILPEPFTAGPVRLLPILLLFGVMFYWLWRVRRRPLTAMIRHDSIHAHLAPREAASR